MSEVLTALRSMVFESGRFSQLARAIKRERHWRLSDHAAEARLSQFLAPENPHQFPADLLPLAIEVCGVDYVSPLLYRAAMRAADRKPARRVERGEAEGRRRA